MHSSGRNHCFVIASIALSLLLCSALIAEPVRPEQVRMVINTFLKRRTTQSDNGPRIFSVPAEAALTGFREIRNEDGAILARLRRAGAARIPRNQFT